MTHNTTKSLMHTLDERTRTIFRKVVETYIKTGEPVGSQTLAKSGIRLSSASIRNVLADLAEIGLLEAPHTSAGRKPSFAGLRLFVDGFLQFGEPSKEDRDFVDTRLKSVDKDFSGVLNEASVLLSGLAGGASLVASPTRDEIVKHVEFVPLGSNEALAILVTEDGDVENRIIRLPEGLPQTSLIEAGNFLSRRLVGKTILQTREAILIELEQHKADLNEAASKLISKGLAEWSSTATDDDRVLIVHGRANLLNDNDVNADLDRVRELFEVMERRKSLIDILDSTRDGDGVRMFIGSENKLFSLSGSSVIISPYMNADRRVIGALGVIAPTRLNYARIIPIIDYTARVVGQLIDSNDKKGP